MSARVQYGRNPKTWRLRPLATASGAATSGSGAAATRGSPATGRPAGPSTGFVVPSDPSATGSSEQTGRCAARPDAPLPGDRHEVAGRVAGRQGPWRRATDAPAVAGPRRVADGHPPARRERVGIGLVGQGLLVLHGRVGAGSGTIRERVGPIGGGGQVGGSGRAIERIRDRRPGFRVDAVRGGGRREERGSGFVDGGNGRRRGGSGDRSPGRHEGEQDRRQADLGPRATGSSAGRGDGKRLPVGGPGGQTHVLGGAWLSSPSPGGGRHGSPDGACEQP